MDYKTRPISREDLRSIAKFMREVFKYKCILRFDVIDAFERFPELFPEVTCTVVEDDEIEEGVPARCIPDMNGHYLIEVKNSVYEGAVSGTGGYRAHILHEMCHAILCLLGFTPILDRAFKNKELKPFESMEWQAKALCGEIMMPYEETEGMTVRQIMNYCKVSAEAAQLRHNNYRKSPSCIL